MNQREGGFTLIELMAVIVILGILAATAVPKFVDLSGAARQAAVDGIAGALASGSSLNHAQNIAVDAGLSTNTPTTVNTCDDLSALLDGGLEEGYNIITTAGTTISGGGIASEGGASTCRVAFDSSGNGDYSNQDVPFSEFTAYGVQ